MNRIFLKTVMFIIGCAFVGNTVFGMEIRPKSDTEIVKVISAKGYAVNREGNYDSWPEIADTYDLTVSELNRYFELDFQKRRLLARQGDLSIDTLRTLKNAEIIAAAMAEQERIAAREREAARLEIEADEMGLDETAVNETEEIETEEIETEGGEPPAIEPPVNEAPVNEALAIEALAIEVPAIEAPQEEIPRIKTILLVGLVGIVIGAGAIGAGALLYNYCYKKRKPEKEKEFTFLCCLRN
jgi:hypothetical protein